MWRLRCDSWGRMSLSLVAIAWRIFVLFKRILVSRALADHHQVFVGMFLSSLHDKMTRILLLLTDSIKRLITIFLFLQILRGQTASPSKVWFLTLDWGLVKMHRPLWLKWHLYFRPFQPVFLLLVLSSISIFDPLALFLSLHLFHVVRRPFPVLNKILQNLVRLLLSI